MTYGFHRVDQKEGLGCESLYKLPSKSRTAHFGHLHLRKVNIQMYGRKEVSLDELNVGLTLVYCET